MVAHAFGRLRQDCHVLEGSLDYTRKAYLSQNAKSAKKKITQFPQGYT